MILRGLMPKGQDARYSIPHSMASPAQRISPALYQRLLREGVRLYAAVELSPSSQYFPVFYS